MLAEMEDVIYNAIGRCCRVPSVLTHLLRRQIGDRGIGPSQCEQQACQQQTVQRRRHLGWTSQSSLPVYDVSITVLYWWAEIRSPREPPCPPTSTGMPTLAGTVAPSSVAVERLTPLTGATEEDPATAGEVMPASIVLPTTEDDTTATAEVSSIAFADIDEAAGRPTPLTGATEDHPPMEEDPASTAEGDTTAPAERMRHYILTNCDEVTSWIK
ncbi:hypothetical protein E2562_009639 [Oryza meyeriana var. granulata]|uniref:Uncharacterized protein n=1 Tax=Oryza meyeriana var. granulata TaxID=110450 RepID=A0A6G1D1P7_9ORYZ|nr:hypothetical protein E2562_009639 [Oryza meyeriana var. granulata]